MASSARRPGEGITVEAGRRRRPARRRHLQVTLSEDGLALLDEIAERLGSCRRGVIEHMLRATAVHYGLRHDLLNPDAPLLPPLRPRIDVLRPHADPAARPPTD